MPVSAVRERTLDPAALEGLGVGASSQVGQRALLRYIAG
jgi:hypothetical protein